MIAHYRAEPEGFFGIDFSAILPFNIMRTWHVQLYYAVDTGYWYARSLAFLNLPWVNILEWARLPGDALFIVGGALPLVWICWQALRYPNLRRVEAETELPRMLYEADRQQT